MINDVAAALALDALPIGSRVAAAFIDEHDDSATIVLFEHRMHEGERRWWDLTRNHVWWTAREITQAHDDMVITANPDQEQPADVCNVGGLYYGSDKGWNNDVSDGGQNMLNQEWIDAIEAFIQSGQPSSCLNGWPHVLGKSVALASDIPQAVFTSIFTPSSVGVKIGRAADMADIACRICHHAESDHTRAHAVKKYGFDTRQACTQCACVEWVAPKEVESVDDVAAVDLIDDLDDARRTMSSVEFDDDLYARTRDFILDAVSENQRLNAVLAHRTAHPRKERELTMSCSCSCHAMPGSAAHIVACCDYPHLTEEDSCPVNHAEEECPWHRTKRRS